MKNTDNKNYIKIAYAPDDNYVPLTLVSMVSVVENTKHNIEFIILYSDLHKNSFNMLDSIKKYKNCTLTYKQLDENQFKDTKKASWVTIQAQFRAILPDLFPEYDKCIYLDCDTALNGDINEFWEIDVSDYLIAAVSDVYNNNVNSERLNLKSNTYFNSGVMLINCKKCREFKLFDKFTECSNNCPNIKLGDQDILNKIIDEKKLLVSPKYNYLEVYWYKFYNEYTDWEAEEYKKARKNPLIIHYTSWKPNNPKNHHSFKAHWWYYACKTDFYTGYITKFIKESNDYIQKLEFYNSLKTKKKNK